jgi:hypothetical protein
MVDFALSEGAKAHAIQEIRDRIPIWQRFSRVAGRPNLGRTHAPGQTLTVFDR